MNFALIIAFLFLFYKIITLFVAAQLAIRHLRQPVLARRSYDPESHGPVLFWLPRALELSVVAALCTIIMGILGAVKEYQADRHRLQPLNILCRKG
jgi:hypothetical protein